jgi:cation diffusion facilitator CzcD-associated flavoprotein CzcO
VQEKIAMSRAPDPSPAASRHVHVAIAGSGFGGLGTAIRLEQSGFRDYLVFERFDDVGGVWRDNTYPGCACDVESHLYSFSFARNPAWTRSFSSAKEIQAYLRDCAVRFGVLPKIRFDHAIIEAAWDDDAQLWRIETKHGIFTADVLVGAVGALSDPAIPALKGLDTFKGVSFHSARWNHAHDLAGRRVAVIGTGASAIQFIPQIQPQVAALKIFQRTAPWIVPRRDKALSDRTRTILGRSKVAQWLFRARIYAVREAMAVAFFDMRAAKVIQNLALKNLSRRIKDPVLRAKLTPNYTMGCKRILLSDNYLPTMRKENVEVITDGIDEICPEGIRTKDSVLHEVDTIIFGTGFQVQEYPFAAHIRGKSGRTLKETWKDGMTAHLGTTVVGYPNLFLLQGPNTGLGHTSVITMIESQIEHVVNAVRYMRASAISSVEPRREAQEAFVSRVDEKMKGTVWSAGGCKSWYLNAAGRNSTIWPGFTFTFKMRTERFRPSEFHLVARRPRKADTNGKSGARMNGHV